MTPSAGRLHIDPDDMARYFGCVAGAVSSSRASRIRRRASLFLLPTTRQWHNNTQSTPQWRYNTHSKRCPCTSAAFWIAPKKGCLLIEFSDSLTPRSTGSVIVDHSLGRRCLHLASGRHRGQPPDFWVLSISDGEFDKALLVVVVTGWARLCNSSIGKKTSTKVGSI
jgi:hypothetical protein